MSTEMSAKLQCMNSDKALFKQFQKLVKRGKYLNVAVILTDANAEVFRYDDGKEEVIAAGVFTYTSNGWKEISDILDSIAYELKGKWSAQFAKLCASNADAEEWMLTLSATDYAELTVGGRSNCKKYKLSWSRKGVLSAMNYLADSCNPQLDD